LPAAFRVYTTIHIERAIPKAYHSSHAARGPFRLPVPTRRPPHLRLKSNPGCTPSPCRCARRNAGTAADSPAFNEYRTASLPQRAASANRGRSEYEPVRSGPRERNGQC
jgi:hypothetical protein